MRRIRLGWWGGACAAVLVAGLIGCGGEEDAVAVEADAAAVSGEPLTEEEAAVLAEFRASRDAANAPGEADHRSKAAPGESGHDDVVAAIKGEPAAEVPYDFDRAQAPKAKATAKPTAPAANAPDPVKPAATRATPNPSANSPTVFIRHQVTDPGMNGMVANTVLVPETWKIEGGIQRGTNQLWFNPIFHDVKYMAPDGRQLHFFPSLSFEFTAQAMQQGAQLFQPINGSLYYPLPETPGKWLMELIRKNPDPTVKNVRLISEEPEPTLTQQLQQQSAAIYQQIQQSKGMAMQTGVDSAFDTQATVIKLQYTRDGIELEESILMTWNYFLNIWQGQVTGGKWAVPLMVSMRGPVGTDYLNDPELLTIVQSLRINPVWQGEMNKYWQELARIQRKGADDRNRQWQAHNAKMQQYRDETSAIIAGGYANRTAIRDAGHAKQIDSVREVSPYNIGGETVKIPDYYDNVHTDGTGRYILSNDFNYNPNRDLNLPGNWTKVDPQR